MSNRKKSPVILCQIAVALMIVVSGGSMAAKDCSDGKTRKSIIENQKLLSQNPNDNQAKINLAKCYLIKNNVDRAERHIQNILNRDNNNVEALLLQGEVYKRTEQWNLANEVYQRVTQLAPNDARAFMELSNVLNTLGRKTEADVAFKRFRQLTDIELN